MKYVLSFLILTLLSAFDFYNPKGFNYQAIIRDASGNIKKNANVTVAFDIVDQSDNTLYSESHSVTTNDFGIINLVIGKGSTSDDFSIVDWTTDELSIKVTLDGTIMGTSPLLSVPYANYANNGITLEQANAITTNTAKVGITTDQESAIALLEGVTSKVQNQIDSKQDSLTAGSGITISNSGIISTSSEVIDLNDLSDVLIADNSVYLGDNPSNSLTEGFNNVSVGSGALGVVTKGWGNSTVGAFAMSSNTTGIGNVAIGGSSLTSNISGNANVAVGFDALYINVDGCCNTALGRYALRESSKNYNTSVGYQSMRSTTEGGNNSALGVNALFSQTEGNDNVAIGNKAMYSNTTGSYNVAIGSEASISSTSGTNQTVIGYNATGKGDNTVVLGNGNITDVYAAEDGDATVHAKGITFSDGTTQTTAVSESKVTFNQVMTNGFTDTDNVLEIGDLVIRVNNNYLEWKVNSGTYSDYFYATVTIKGSTSGEWNSMNSGPNVGDKGSIQARGLYQQIVDITNEYYNGSQSAGFPTNPGLWFYRMVEIELINTSVNESYKITAFGHGSGRATIKGEYWNFK